MIPVYESKFRTADENGHLFLWLCIYFCDLDDAVKSLSDIMPLVQGW